MWPRWPAIVLSPLSTATARNGCWRWHIKALRWLNDAILFRGFRPLITGMSDQQLLIEQAVERALRERDRIEDAQDDEELQAAMTVIAGDPREGPLYGPWNLALTKKVFKIFCKPPLFTFTFPQLPLLRSVDTVEEEAVPDQDEDDDEDTDVVSADIGPTTPPRSRAAAPSPDVYMGDRLDLPNTPQALFTGPSPVAHTPQDTGENWSSAASTQTNTRNVRVTEATKRSTRIPDFVQVVYKLLNGGSFAKCTLLLVEIKRPNHKKDFLWAYTEVLSQTEQQANHAFSEDPNADTLGVIIAIGNKWTYREYHRATTWIGSVYRRSGSLYRESSTPEPEADPAAIYPPVENLLPEGYAVLGTPESNRAMTAVRVRMLELCRNRFGPHVAS